MQLPTAIVLAFTGTGLAVARSLSICGVPVTAAVFGAQALSAPETCWSRRCKVIRLGFREHEWDALLHWLLDYALTLDRPPVVFPTSDASALFLATHREQLAGRCLTWQTSCTQLESIVSKDGLYRAAQAAGVPVPPMLIEPDLDELREWCARTSPPYIAKPFYQGIPESGVRAKNCSFDDTAGLLDFAAQHGTHRAIVQRMIDAGDGRVLDVYGLCDRSGKILALASHRRIRQYPPNTGATSFGEIPLSDPGMEQQCFALTRTLLGQFNYHGIFGIEWLHERESGNLYLTDFNARPFSTIGHLRDCGLNLPYLAYQEMIDENPPKIELYPPLPHTFWMDFNCDLRGFRMTKKSTGYGWSLFIRDLLRCRSFAYLDPGDPGPAISRGLSLLSIISEYLKRTLNARPGT